MLDFVRPPKEKRLPVVMSRDEVRRVLRFVKVNLYRVCLTTIYSCGLRLREGTQLQVEQIDSGRMLLHIVGKGNKQRDVPLSKSTLQMLREFWRTNRSLAEEATGRVPRRSCRQRESRLSHLTSVKPPARSQG